MPPKRLLVFLILLLVVGCRQQPEAEPTATVPPAEVDSEETVVPTSTPLPPTVTATLTAVPPTATPLPTETLLPPTDTPTPVPDVALTVTAPAAETSLEIGSEVMVAGEAMPGGEPLTVLLETAGITLVENTVSLESNTTAWEVALTVPESVSGRAFLRVSQPGGTTVEVPVLLQRPATSGTSISLSHPDVETTAVASQVLFFQGRVQQPVNGEITIAVLYEECQTAGARQTFEVGEGGLWWGYVVIPETVFGPACAVAYTGEFEAEGWRAAAMPLTILEANDPAAQGVFVGNFPFQELVPGEQVAIYGRAYNADEVEVSLQVAGQVVAEGTAAVDRFGYWETELTLPADVAGSEGFFVATTIYGAQTLEERNSFLIVDDE